MGSLIDDSLYLSWNKKENRPMCATESALSVSSMKAMKEDPHRWFLRKVVKLKEPNSTPLMFGNAVHTAFEDFQVMAGSERVKTGLEAMYAYIRENFSTIENPVVNVNPDDPSNPRGKQQIPITAEYLIQLGGYLMDPILRTIDSGWDRYSVIQTQSVVGGDVELTLGDLAKRHAYDYEMLRIFDSRDKVWKDLNTAVIHGVPVHGYVDFCGKWVDGTDVIIDHKCVGNVVPFYPSWKEGAPRTGYSPSYNPATDIQLDIYSYTTGIVRSGFQFVTKNPQYVPPSGVLYEDWMDENAWKEAEDVTGKLPMAWMRNQNNDLHYMSIVRPTPEDHPSKPMGFVRDRIAPRTVNYVRKVAEYLTESCILFQAGVDPSIAFPAGSPADIGKKSCPYCVWGPNSSQACPSPRLVGNAKEKKASNKSYELQNFEREKACLQNKDIIERRELWKADCLPA